MTADISDIKPGSLVKTYKYIDIADGNLCHREKNGISSNKNA